jgi:hypothetical protein
MSALTQRWRNTSPVFRILFLLLLLVLLLLLCAALIFQFVLPNIDLPIPGPSTKTPTATTVAPTTETPAEPATATHTSTPTPTQTPVVTGEVPGETETVTVSVTPGTGTPETVTPGTITPTEPVTPTETVTVTIETRNVIRNGNFEEGFQANELGKYWNGFNNGDAKFSFHIDDWTLIVPEGTYAQLIEIKEASQPDRYLGMYQTVDVIPGEEYTFSMQGMVRTNTGDVEKTSYGYRLQVGFDLSGGQDWEGVEDWTEMQWDEQLRVQDSFRFDDYTTTLTATGDQLTVFIRAWKKWADLGEGDYNVDDIQLVGPARVVPSAPGVPVTGGAADTIWENVRVWATIALLLLLVGGAIWRFGWKRV